MVRHATGADYLTAAALSIDSGVLTLFGDTNVNSIDDVITVDRAHEVETIQPVCAPWGW